MKRSILLMSLVAFTVACEDRGELKARENLKNHYDQITASAGQMLTSLEGIKQACAGLPPAKDIGNIEAYGNPLVRKSSQRNLFYVHLSDLTRMVYREAAPDLDNTQPWINITKELARAKATLQAKEGSIPYFPLKDAWKGFSKVEYLLVVRGETVPPKEAAGDTFTPGFFQGDAQLFWLHTGKHLGGFPLKVVSSGEIKVIYSNKNKWADIESDLMKDLSKRLLLAIKTSLEIATRKKIK